MRWSSSLRRAPVGIAAMLLAMSELAAASDTAPLFQTLRARLSPEATVEHLSGASIRDLHQDRDGRLWLATGRGVLVFDGQRFSAVQSDTPLSQPGRALAAATSGGLWLLLENPLRVLRHKNGALEEPFTLSSGNGGLTGDILESGSGDLWIGTDEGLFRWDGRSLNRYGKAEGLPALQVTALHEDAEGGVWVATPAGLCVVRQARCEARLQGEVHAITTGTDGRLWVGTNEGLVRLNPATGLRIEAALGAWSRYKVWAINRDEQGKMWVGSSDSLLMGDHNGLQDVGGGRFYEPHITRILRTTDGTVWIGTSGAGLLQFNPDHPLVVIGPEQGLRLRVVFSVLPRSDGQVWIGTAMGYTLLNEQASQLPDAFSGPLDHPVAKWKVISNMAYGEGDALVLGTHDGGLYRVEDGALVELAPERGETHADSVSSLSRANDGTLFVGFQNGRLGRLRSKDVGISSIMSLPCQGRVVGMCWDTANTLWLATEDAGVCRIPAGAHKAERLPGLPTQRYHTIYCPSASEAQQDIWAGTVDAGLLWWHEGRLIQIGPKQGLPANEVSQVIHDGGGNLWVGSPMGIFRMAASEVAAVGEGLRSNVRAYMHFDARSGMRSSHLTYNQSPPVARSASGALYFPTVNGLVVFPSPEAVLPPPLPNVTVHTLQLAGKRVSISGFSAEPMPRENGHVAIGFSAADFTTPHRLDLQYRLLGVDEGWTTANDLRTVQYANLHPGSHRFEVRVRSWDHAETKSAQLSFTLVPRFHETLAFKLGLIALALGLGTLGVHLRFTRLRNRYDAIIDERRRISQDLHDTIEQSLVGAKLQIEGAQRTLADPKRASPFMARAREMIERSMRETKSSIWVMRSGLSDHADLKSSLSAIIGSALAGTRVDFKLESLGVPFRLEPEAERQAVRIVQEAVTNALKHGDPGTISILLEFGAEKLRAVCADDGSGFDATESVAGAHYGLRGMKERAASLSGSLEVSSRPGHGTMVVLEVPRNPSNTKRSGRPLRVK